MRRADQAAGGQAVLVYIEGKSGIGKTSLAHYCKETLERTKRAIGIHAFFGDESAFVSQKDVVCRIVESMSATPTLFGKMQSLFQKYVKEVSVPGIKVTTQESRSPTDDVPKFLSVVGDFHAQLATERDKCVMLILDEIDTLTHKPFFARFIRDLIEEHGVSRKRPPLLIVLCGSQKSLKAIVNIAPRLLHMLDQVSLKELECSEIEHFYKIAFRRLGQEITPSALEILVEFCHGLPRHMHVIGAGIYDCSKRGQTIGRKEASTGVRYAAERTVKKYLNEDIVERLVGDSRYSRVFERLREEPLALTFTYRDLLNRIGVDKAKLATSFIRLLKACGAIEKTSKRGEWRFVDLLVSLYIHTRQACSDLMSFDEQVR